MPQYIGKIEVICGSMFSGKTEELIRRVRRAIIADLKVQIFKPIVDNRYGLDQVSSHNGESIKALAVNDAKQILKLLDVNTKVVAVDEAQFFDPEITSVVQTLADKHHLRVIVAGLHTDFRGEPFGSMPELILKADQVQLLVAICEVCKVENAVCTQRLVNGKPASYSDELILIAAEEAYEARCRNHHFVPGKPK